MYNKDQREIPYFDELLPRYKVHPLANVKSIRQLKEAAVIMATSAIYEKPLILYGADVFERARDDEEVTILSVEVSSFEELQFVLSAIQKFVGQPDTNGEPWRDL